MKFSVHDFGSIYVVHFLRFPVFLFFLFLLSLASLERTATKAIFFLLRIHWNWCPWSQPMLVLLSSLPHSSPPFLFQFYKVISVTICVLGIVHQLCNYLLMANTCCTSFWLFHCSKIYDNGNASCISKSLSLIHSELPSFFVSLTSHVHLQFDQLLYSHLWLNDIVSGSVAFRYTMQFISWHFCESYASTLWLKLICS